MCADIRKEVRCWLILKLIMLMMFMLVLLVRLVLLLVLLLLVVVLVRELVRTYVVAVLGRWALRDEVCW